LSAQLRKSRKYKGGKNGGIGFEKEIFDVIKLFLLIAINIRNLNHHIGIIKKKHLS